MSNRISNMARTQLSTLLSYKPCKENKKRTKEFCEYLKNRSKDIYNIYCHRKVTLLLIKTKYILYFPIAWGYYIAKK